jgi:hypothetical protein
MNSRTRTSPTGNSTSTETPADSHFTHHHNRHRDVLKGAEEEAEEVDYLLRPDQAYSLPTDEPLIITSF